MTAHSQRLASILLPAVVLASAATAQTQSRTAAVPGGPVIQQTGVPGNVVKSVTDVNGGSVIAGDTLRYTISVTNSGGPDDALFVTLLDTLPTNVTYIRNSLAILSGPNAGAKTDQANDDEAQFQQSQRRIRFRLGTGATPTVGGTLVPNASTSVTFLVVVNAGVTTGAVSNQAWVLFDDAAGGIEVQTPSRPPGGPAGGAPTVVPVETPDVTIGKTHAGTFVRGTQGTYTLTVNNVGPGITRGTITVRDTLPAGLIPTGASGSGWLCTITGQAVLCTTSAVIAAGASAPAITLTVDVLNVAPNTVTNIGRVSGGAEANTGNNSASDPTGIVSNAVDLSITKTATSAFTVGSNATYSLAVSNVGSAATTGTITITDTLPTGLTFGGGVGSGWSCAATGQVVTCSNAGPIAPAGNSTVSLTVAVGAPAAPSVTNRAHVETPGDGVAGNNSSSVTTPVTVPAVPDLRITKTHFGSLVAFRNEDYTLTVFNDGGAATTGAITVVDTLPTGLTFNSASGGGWSCVAAGQVVTCTNPGPIAAAGSSVFTMSVAVGPAAYPAIVNRAHVSTPGETNTGNNTAVDPGVVESIPDLAMVKTATSAFTIGSPATYSLQITNISTGPTAGAITVTDNLPNGLTFVSGTGTGWTCSAAGQVVTCTNPGPIASAGVTTITLTVNVSAAAAPSVSNTATVSTLFDANPANDASTVVTPVVAPSIPNLSITKTHAGTFQAGQNGTYSLTVTNVGTAATTGAITVVDTLPNGLTFGSGVGAGWSCTAAGAVVTCTNGSPLAVSGATVITLTVGVGAAAIPGVTNRAHVSTPGDSDPSNDQASDPTSVVSIPDLAITKVASGTFTAGQNASYTLTVTNVSTGPTTGSITVNDVLPAGLSFVSGTGGGFSCSAAGQSVTCNNPGPLGAGGSAAITLAVAVASNVSSSITNTATVTTPGDLNTGNNSSTVVTPIAGAGVDLSIVKTVGERLVPGRNGTYRLTVTNNSLTATTGVTTVTDVLPAGLSFVSGSGGGFTCAVSGQTVTCTNSGVMQSGQQSVIVLAVAVAPGLSGSLTNAATVSTPGDTDPGNNTSTITTPLGTGIDLAIGKTSSVLTVGGTGTFTLSVANVGVNPTTGTITVTDNLPAGVTFVSGTGGNFTCTATGQLVTCTRTAPLPPGTTVQLVLTVQVGTAAFPSIVNTATVSTPGDENPANDTATTGVVPVGAATPDLSLSKTLASALTAGTNAVFRLTVTNVGSAPATGLITITDVLQAGLTFVSASGSGWSCAANGQTVTCTHPGPLAPGASSTVDLTVAVAANVTSVTNSATVSTPGDGNGGNNTGTLAPTPVAAPPDLALTKVANGPFLVGQPASYTITVTNVGGPTVGPITVTDVVPAGLTVVSAAGNGWTCTISGQTVTCTHPGPLAPNGTLSLTVQVVPTAAAVPSVTNVANVGTPGDANPGNNDGTVTTPVSGTVDLALTKSGADTISVGGTVTYSLVVTNLGSVPTTGPISITDSLPTGLSFVSGAGPGFTCSAAGQIVTCTRSTPPLAPGATATVTLTVNVSSDVGASVRNVACVRTTGDANTANDCGSKTSTPAGQSDLVALKDVVGTVEVGKNATFTLAVRNIGTVPARPPITMVDTLPAGLTFVSASGTGWQCGATGNIVTCIRPTALPPGLSPPVTLVVSVGPAAFPRVANCLDVRGTNETGPLANNRSCAEPAVAGVGRLEITKAVSRREVQIGDVVDYIVTVRNSGNGDLTDVTVTDVFPAGFLLETASVRVNGAGGIGITGEPGPRVVFDVGRVLAGQQVTLTYRLRVGPGARPGTATNVAVAESKTRGGTTAPARATVRISGGVFDERGAIVGKVYVDCDCNKDKHQDAGELGIPGVRVYLEDGTSAVTDVEGKYSFYNVSSRLHVVKIDRMTLPEGAVLVPLVNRNAGDGYTRFADVKAGELHRADFAEGSRSAEVLARVIERRRGGEVNNAGERPVPTWYPGAEGVMASPRDTLRGPARAAHDLATERGTQGASMYAARPLYPRALTDNDAMPYQPLASGRTIDDRNSQLPVTPLRARELQRNAATTAERLTITAHSQAMPADGQTLVPITVMVLGQDGEPVRRTMAATLEASVGHWLNTTPLETSSSGWQVTLVDGVGKFFLVAPPSPARGEVRVTTDWSEATTPVTFAATNRDLLVTGLLNARIDWQKLVKGGLGLSSGGDAFEESLRDWSFDDDSGETRGGARAALLMKGTVLDSRLLTLSYDSERDRGRTFFRDISPNEFFPVYGDASIREFDAQSRRRFYARLDKGTGYTMYGDFQTTRSDDRRVLSSYERSLTGAVQHFEGRNGSATFFASQGRISQAVDEIPGQGISGPYVLSRATGLINSERVEILVRDRNQRSIVLSRRAMTRFADYTIEPVTGRLLFRAPVPSADANLNPVTIRVTYETEDGASDAFWIYGFDGSVRAGRRVELGGTFAKDDGATSGHQLVGFNATAKLTTGTTLFGEFARTENAIGTSGQAQRVELRHQSASFDARLFGVSSDRDFSNQSSILAGGRTELGGRFSKLLTAGTRLNGEFLRSDSDALGARTGALLTLDKQLTPAWRLEAGYRYANDKESDPSQGGRDVSALRARVQWTLPEQTRTSLFGEVEQDVRDGDQRRIALGGEYLIASRARLYGRHEFLNKMRDPYFPTPGTDRQVTVFGIDADYLKNTQMFSEYRARDAFAGRDAEASIGLRNRWAIAPGLLVNTSFERVSQLFSNAGTVRDDALAVTGAVEWTKPSLWKSTARLEFRDAEDGDNTLASFGYARKLSRDWTLLARTLWDDYDALQRQTRGFSQFGLAWRQTDRNTWNALARYEHRFERLGSTGAAAATRDQAHILAALVNVQPVDRFTLSGRYAARRSSNWLDGSTTTSTAQLLMARGIVDLSNRLDMGLIASSLFSDGFSDRRYGLGGELGLIVMKNLRIAGGYNVFGFTDRDLNTFGTTRKGPYLELGFKFDESLFGIGDSPAGSARRGGNDR